MKKTSKILLFVMALLIFSHVLVQPSFATGSAAALTREDAVALFDQAIECIHVLQFVTPFFDTLDDTDNTGYFDYSVYGNGKSFNGEHYFMVNKNHKYGTLDKTKAWAEGIFTQNLASEYVKKNIYYQSIGYSGENFLYDDNGNLWKKIFGGQFGFETKYNVLKFSSDSNHAVLTVESLEKHMAPRNMVTNTVKFEKTSAGWRVAESGYFNYYLGIAPPDGSPNTGDVTAARAAVFTAGAVLAAAVPALILTVKHRREEE